jgi:hypothetical protein
MRPSRPRSNTTLEEFEYELRVLPVLVGIYVIYVLHAMPGEEGPWRSFARRRDVLPARLLGAPVELPCIVIRPLEVLGARSVSSGHIISPVHEVLEQGLALPPGKRVDQLLDGEEIAAHSRQRPLLAISPIAPETRLRLLRIQAGAA